MNVEESDRDLLLVSIFTFLTVLSWVFFELIKTVNTSTVKEPVQQVIKPLNPKLNAEILSELISRDTYATMTINQLDVIEETNDLNELITNDQQTVNDNTAPIELLNTNEEP